VIVILESSDSIKTSGYVLVSVYHKAAKYARGEGEIGADMRKDCAQTTARAQIK
jgi:hypothetical protein